MTPSLDDLERRNRELMAQIYGRTTAPPSTGEGNVDISFLEAKQRELESKFYGRTSQKSPALTQRDGGVQGVEPFQVPDIVGPISRFIDRNKDWIWDVGLAVGAATLAPVFLSGKSLRMVRIAAFAYAAYVVYRNWHRIRLATWG
jgi:hypothetical protein